LFVFFYQVAKAYTFLYAIIMTAVVVGTAVQIVDDVDAGSGESGGSEGSNTTSKNTTTTIATTTTPAAPNQREYWVL
jgi:hypothetical protein